MVKYARVFFSLAITLALFALLSSTTKWWSSSGEVILDSGKYLLIPIVGMLLLAVCFVRGNWRELRLEPASFGAGLLLVFFSDWMCRGYTLLQGPAIRGEIVLGTLLTLVVLRKHWLKVLAYFTPFALVMMAVSFFVTADGRVIFGDDHASFYYRLMLLKENFPNIPFYNPLWNGGIESREFFPSGILNVFFLTAPLIYTFDVEKLYSIIVAIIMFVITPAGTYIACRLEKLNSPIPALAALLAASNSMIWYEWALSYGTVGFITSVGFIPIILVLASKVLSADESLSFKETILLAVCTTLMLFWSLSGVVFLPLILVGAVLLKRVLKKRYMLTMFIALFLINVPWIIIFVQASNVFSFMGSEKNATVQVQKKEQEDNLDYKKVDPLVVNIEQSVPVAKRRKYKHRAGGFSFSEAKKQIRQKASSSNALLLFMAIPGIFLLRRRTKIAYLLIGFWLLFLGSVAVPLKPQLELDRMLIVLLFIFAIPSAVAIYEVMRRSVEKPAICNTCVAAVLGGFLFAAPFSVSGILNNRTLSQIYFKTPTYQELSEAVKTNLNQDGRVLFAGFILHQLSNGHIAPLAMELNRPMIASSYQHDKWWYTDVIPVEYLREGRTGMEKYFDLYNVEAIIAHEPNHKKLFISQPDKYQLVWRSYQDKFMLFKRLGFKSNYFLEGSGKVIEQTTNHVSFELDLPEVVIKFTYLPFVKVEGCQVEPYEISEHVTFIKLKECPVHKELRLDAENAIERFFLKPLRKDK